MKPSFTISLIARNEAKTLPRLIKSLEEFQRRGGEVVLVDTGSTDSTPDLARSLGVKVEEVGERFMFEATEELAARINECFIVDNEQPVIKGGDRFFDYASARNYSASLASTDYISVVDCDEFFTTLNIDAVEQAIKDGYEFIEHHFIFARAENGLPAIQFTCARFYDRRKCHWKGVVHEFLDGDARHTYLPASVIELEHCQDQSAAPRRSKYLGGLAMACYNDLTNDRNSHYFAREMHWTGRPKSAIKEFERHVAMNRWAQERSQSLVFIGEAYMNMGEEQKALDYWHHAIDVDGTRREPWLKLADYYYRKDNKQKVASYVAAALEIPLNDCYCNIGAHYMNYPHELLYWALWYLGDKKRSKEHWQKAIEFEPTNPKYIADKQFYGEPTPKKEFKDWPQDIHPERLFALKHTKGCEVVVDVGCGRHKTMESAVGVDINPGTDIQTSGDNLPMKSGTVDCIISRHSFEHMLDPIAALEEWQRVLKPGGRVVFVLPDHNVIDSMDPFYSGGQHLHAYTSHSLRTLIMSLEGWRIVGTDIVVPQWSFGLIIEKVGKEPKSLPMSLLGSMQRKIEAGTPFSFVKCGDGEQLCMDGAEGGNCDGHPYSPELGTRLRESFNFLQLQPNVQVFQFEDQQNFNVLLHRTDQPLRPRREFWGVVASSTHKKVFIGPERLQGVARILRADHIIVPLVNAFSHYDEIMAKLNARLEEGGIYIFSAGMMAKVLIADALQVCPSITCLDAGSSFDPLFMPHTRTMQAPKETLEKLYIDLIPPMVSILIPTLGRPTGLQRCLDSIERLSYGRSNIEVLIDDDPHDTVPVKVNRMAKRSVGDLLVFASNDIEFTSHSLTLAVEEAQLHGLVGFNTGSKEERCEHFLIRRELIDRLGGEVFSERFHHVGCDNLLWAKCEKMGEAYWCEEAIVHHYHFSRTKGVEMDEVYQKGWLQVEKDREILKSEMAKL